MKCIKFLPLAALFGLSTTGAFAQVILPTFNNYNSILGGTTADYQWSGYASETRPAGVSSSINGAAGQWLAGIAPNGGSPNIRFSGSASNSSDTTDFLTTANQGGIYSFFSQTHFQLNSTVPLSNMESLVLQLYFAEGVSSTTGGSAVTLAASPTLSLTTSSGTFNLSPNYSLFASATPAVVLGMNTNLDLFNYQWDLSSIPGTVQGYTVSWQAPFHGILYGQDATESSAPHATNVLVPEPSSAVASLGGLALLLMKRRFRRATAA